MTRGAVPAVRFAGADHWRLPPEFGSLYMQALAELAGPPTLLGDTSLISVGPGSTLVVSRTKFALTSQVGATHTGGNETGKLEDGVHNCLVSMIVGFWVNCEP